MFCHKIPSCIAYLKYYKNLIFFRLKCSESVQYFQFDKDGNMYVFEPGSGFSGPCVRVEPGFELDECGESSSVTELPSQMSQENY